MTGRLPSIAVALFLGAAAQMASALDLPAGARLTVERLAEGERYAAATGPFSDGAIPRLTLDGTVHQRAWRIPGTRLTPLQLLRPLIAHFRAAGYTPVFDCAAPACGGFDFRFGIDVLPAPGMYVALRRFHFATLRDGDNGLVTVLVSTTSDAGYIQIDEVRAEDPAPPASPARPAGEIALETRTLDLGAESLLETGSTVLADLDFASGAARLGDGPFGSLAMLGDLLTANPGLRIALVGHTDSVGSLDENIALSRARALAVRQRLVEAHGVDPIRVEAHGAGYLAPVASNVTQDGRARNRRVEAILLSR